jgi:hypothetical protein
MSVGYVHEFREPSILLEIVKLGTDVGVANIWVPHDAFDFLVPVDLQEFYLPKPLMQLHEADWPASMAESWMLFYPE